MRVAIIGMGAIGHVLERALERQVDLVRIDRTRAPLREGEARVDAAIVAVKTYGNAWAADVAQRILGPGGVLATVQNGLGNVEAFASAIGPRRVALGVIYVGAEFDGDRFEATGAGRVELGRPDDPAARAELERLAGALGAGGMDVTVVDDPWPSVWRKLVVNAAMNPTTAIFGLRNPELLDHAAGRAIADDLARETARVATAAGIPIDPETAPDMWHRTAAFVNRSSMLQDMQAKRPTEIDSINGAVAREGQRLGVAAPVNEAIALLIKAVEASSP